MIPHTVLKSARRSLVALVAATLLPPAFVCLSGCDGSGGDMVGREEISVKRAGGGASETSKDDSKKATKPRGRGNND